MSNLAANIMHFGRVLRRCGLAAGPSTIATAQQALEIIDISRRSDVFDALHAVFVERRAQSDVFKLAFDTFWQVSPHERAPSGTENHRALAPDDSKSGGDISLQSHTAVDDVISGRWSSGESLRTKDFARMDVAELAEARRLISSVRLPTPEIVTRRFRSGATHSIVDMRATFRAMVRNNGLIKLQYKRRCSRAPALVVLCDISGSMEPYARMMLHFLHALANDRDRMHTFLFGTRLTNVTRQLAHRDPDDALSQVAKAVQDWSGGTRIGEAIAAFNRLWSRRVLAQGAIVLLITDGLDRDGGEGLSEEMQRLHRSCRRLIWLNPLLRYSAFEPKSAGIRAMMPHVDDFRPVHNLDSLAALVSALNMPAGRKAA